MLPWIQFHCSRCGILPRWAQRARAEGPCRWKGAGLHVAMIPAPKFFGPIKEAPCCVTRVTRLVVLWSVQMAARRASLRVNTATALTSYCLWPGFNGPADTFTLSGSFAGVCRGFCAYLTCLTFQLFVFKRAWLPTMSRHGFITQDPLFTCNDAAVFKSKTIYTINESKHCQYYPTLTASIWT